MGGSQNEDLRVDFDSRWLSCDSGRYPFAHRFTPITPISIAILPGLCYEGLRRYEMTPIRRLSLSAAIAIALSSYADAANIYFPSGGSNPTANPPYNPDEFTVNQPIGSSNSADLIVVGYAHDSTNAFPLPYPFRAPYKTTVNILENGSFLSNTNIHSGSTVNLFPGSLISRNVNLFDDSTLNVTDATLGNTVNVQNTATLNLTSATMPFGSIILNTSSKATLTNSSLLGTVTAGNTSSATLTGSSAGRLVVQDLANATMTGGSLRTDALATGTGTLELSGVAIGFGVVAGNFAVISVSAGTIGGDATANHFSTIALGDRVTVQGNAVALGGTIVLQNATVDGNLDVASTTGVRVGGTGIGLMSGGLVRGDLLAHGDASAIVSGGTIEGAAFAYGRSRLSITGPDVLLTSLYSIDQAAAYLIDGGVSGGILANGGTIDVSGGFSRRGGGGTRRPAALSAQQSMQLRTLLSS